MNESGPAPWKPDWTLPPGEILTELLEERAIPPALFAEVSGIDAETLDSLLKGTQPLAPAHADAIAAATATPAVLWLNLQRDYERRTD